MRDDEPGNPQEDSPASTLFRLTYVLAIAVGLYALSPGPIAKFVQCTFGQATPSMARAAVIVYAPIVFVIRHVPAVEHFYNWYMKDIWRLH